MIAVLLLAMISESSIEYTIEEHGPHTVYAGIAKLYSTEDSKFPCLDFRSSSRGSSSETDQLMVFGQ